MKADWHYELSGARQHYVLEAMVERAVGGRAYGWFQADSRFVLEKIEVTAALRSKGYGTLLIDELRSKAREMGCTGLVIQGVRAGNRRAIKLYESLGAVAQPATDGLCDFVFSPP